MTEYLIVADFACANPDIGIMGNSLIYTVLFATAFRLIAAAAALQSDVLYQPYSAKGGAQADDARVDPVFLEYHPSAISPVILGT